MKLAPLNKSGSPTTKGQSMTPLCSIALLAASLTMEAPHKPNPLERQGDPLPVVKLPLGQLPPPAKATEPPQLDKGHPPMTEVAVEGEFQMADKDFQPLRIRVKILGKTNGGVWATAGSHVGGKPVKVKEGLYRYRNVIKTPPRARTFLIEVHGLHLNGHELISSAMLDVDEDLEGRSLRK